MKKLYTAIFSVIASASLVSPVFAMTGDNADIQVRLNAMLDAVANGHSSVSLAADRYNSDVESVMHLNGITREQAVARIARALIAQNGYMPKPPIANGYGAAYDPAPHAFRQAASRMYYAGINSLNGQPVFTVEQRDPLLDSFWYCAPGLTYVYGVDKSVCK